MFHEWILSLVRTVVPKAVGGVLGWLALHGIVIEGLTEGQISLGATVLGAAVYYAVVRALELKYPVLGVLLGSTKQPSYSKSKAGA
ncbi:hypothetical protein GCM10023194_80840 [Planotetraspora phitsanulokensis]|uniref:Uncharacterized protein n=1 Tax=Planotetraspora phitsanulokensis TaxID=575192 RepID=A0A8J3UGL1_9ACTN|nr:hypothetical protein [Planotetraspora phitsanulokensis]GII42916.1 hypothetical protein Pph01_79190 [Planotetraspora phitsanulokensis]